jgi:ABC-type antimicrobial peptide transport system permease subunit
MRIVFRSALVSVGAGMLAGVTLTVALNRILGQWVKNGSRDPLILLAGAFLLIAVSVVACAAPAWRASAADPMTALRSE